MLLKVVLSSLFSLIVLFFITRLLGKRQVSQLNFFDYINGITIGSIAAELSIASGRDRLPPLISMLVYGAVCFLISLLTNKSIMARRFFTGKPILLFENGRLYEKNLMRARLDINEFLTQLRLQGYFDLSDVQVAVLEINGGVSVLPKGGSRPATPDDLGVKVQPDFPPAAVIIDGRVMSKNLLHTGKNQDWLQNELKNLNARAEDLILATVGRDSKLTIYKKTGELVNRDIFS